MASSLRTKVIQSGLEGKVHIKDLSSEDLQYSNVSRQELSQAEDKPDFLKYMESLRSSKAAPNSCTNVHNDLTKLNQDAQDNTAFPENILSNTEKLAKEITSEESSAPMEHPRILSAECTDSKIFPGKTELTGFLHLPLSHDSESSLKIEVPSDTSKSKDSRKASGSAPNTQLVQTVSGGFEAVPDTDEILLRESLTNIQNCEKFRTRFVPKNLDFHSGENRMDEDERKLSQTLTMSGGCIISSDCSSPLKEFFPAFDSPLLSLAYFGVNEENELPYQDMKPPIQLLNDSNNSNDSLTEILYTLEKWARRHQDAFFTLDTSENIVNYFEKDLDHGLCIMKQMTTRIYILMTTANKLPDVDTILLSETKRRKNRIRGDLISTGIKLWHSIDDIELKLFKDYMKLKSICDASEKSNKVNCVEQNTDPKSLIINAFTKVIQRLLLLRAQIEIFRFKIRLYCSEIDKLL